MILYGHDSNGSSSRTQTELLRAYCILLNRFIVAGVRQTIQRMDNKVSALFKLFLQSQGIALELTPAHVHRRNAAERAILTWKNHFLAGLTSMNPGFPIQYWSYLLPQSELTLNLLFQSRRNPKLSAYTQLHGVLDFNKTPFLAPPGREIIAFTHRHNAQPGVTMGTKPGMYGQQCSTILVCMPSMNQQAGKPPSKPCSSSPATTFPCQRFRRMILPSKPHKISQLPSNTHTLRPRFCLPMRNTLRTCAKWPPSSPRWPNESPSPRAPTDVGTSSGQAHHAQTATTRAVTPKALHDVVVPTAITPLHMVNAVFDPDTGQNLKYRQLIWHPKHQRTWLHSAANKFGRLAQGIRNV